MPKVARFGTFFKSSRLANKLGLREFCQKYGLDAGNISKLERGVLPPPSSQKKLEEYAGYLAINEGSDDWYEFFDLAASESGKIPSDLMLDERLVEKLPVFFRTIRGQKVPEEKLDELIKLVRGT
jgi:transcriptional regulator with XRE-family HTH domain